jgi:lysophospholipase L1-like esterase
MWTTGLAIVSMIAAQGGVVWQTPSPEKAALRGPWLWVEDGGRFQWPSAGLTLRFSGPALHLRFDDEAPGGAHSVAGENSNSLAIRVNGGEWKRHDLTPEPVEITIPGPGGEATVDIRKRTEGSVGAVRWTAVGVAPGGRLLAPPKALPELHVYGDSNSCGYGVEAAGREVRYSPSTQNSEAAFAALAAEKLGLELSLVAASGWGVMRGYGGEEQFNIPRVAGRALLRDEENQPGLRRKPSVIAVVLGSNDFAQGDPGPRFDDAYLAFARRLAAEHPGVPMLLCISASMSDSPQKKTRTRVGEVIDRAVSALGGQAKRFDFPRYSPDWGWGADWHFSAKGQAELAELFADAVAESMSRKAD